MAKRNGLVFESVAKGYFEKLLETRLSGRQIVLNIRGERITYRVDLATDDEKTLIACKSYTFRPGGKRPNGKFDEAKRDTLLLALSGAKRKILIFDDDVHPKSGSLASSFERWSRKWRCDVEIWKHWADTFEIMYPKAL